MIKIRFQEYKFADKQMNFWLLYEAELQSIPSKTDKIHFQENSIDYIFEIIDIHHTIESGRVEINLKRIGISGDYNTKLLKSLG